MAKSHPTYDMFGKHKGDFWERNKHIEIPLPFTPEAEERSAEFAEKYGRAWYVFTYMKLGHEEKKKAWISQFEVKERKKNE